MLSNRLLAGVKWTCQTACRACKHHGVNQEGSVAKVYSRLGHKTFEQEAILATGWDV